MTGPVHNSFLFFIFSSSVSVSCEFVVKLTVVADVGILAFIIWWLKKEMIIKCDSKFGCFVHVRSCLEMVFYPVHAGSSSRRRKNDL